MLRRLTITALVAAIVGAAFAVPAASAHAASGCTDKKFTFGLLADIQYADKDRPATSTRYYRDSPAKLVDAAKVINAAKPTFTVQLGDIIDTKEASYDTILPYWEKIEGKRYNVLGNHEFDQVAPDVAKARMGMQQSYYHWSVCGLNGYRFVVLDTTKVSTFANLPGSRDHQRAVDAIAALKAKSAPNAQTWNGGVGPEQLKWLRRTLFDAKMYGQKVIVMGHAPVIGVNMHNAFDSEAIRAEFDRAGNVVAYFNGHDHAGRYEMHQGIHYVNMLGFVEQAYPTTQYALVTVEPGKIIVDGRGREPFRELTTKK